MGVVGLWKVLKPSGIEEEPLNKKLAVDVSIWIHQYKNMNDDDIVFYVSKKITKLLFHKIKPVFVFDGKPHPLKKEVLEKRRKENQTNIIKDIVNNNICKICKIKVRICRHGGILNEESRKLKDKEIFNLLENHNFNWGREIDVVEAEDPISSEKKENQYKIDTEDAYEKFDKKAISKDNSRIEKHKKSHIYSKTFAGFDDIFDLVNSHEYSTKYKLQCLVKMRERRKERLDFDDSDINTFSQSQLKNIKKRNLVSYYIRKLENGQVKRIYSNSNKVYKFVKDNKEEKNDNELKKVVQEVDEKIKNSSDEELSLFLKTEDGLIEKDKEVCNSCSQSDEESIFKDDEEFFSPEEDSKIAFGNELIVKSTEEFRPSAGFFGTIVSDDTESYESSDEMEFINDDNTIEDKSFYRLNNLDDGFCDFTSKQTLFKNLISSFNLPYIESLSESDSQCGFLSKEKIVDGVITEDNDILLYGGTVYKNFYRKNKSIEKYSLERIETIQGLSQLDLIKISYALGSDYSVGIKGVGPKTVEGYIKSDDFKNLDCGNYINIFTNPSVKNISRIEFGIIDIRKIIKFLSHHNVSHERRNELFFYLRQLKNT